MDASDQVVFVLQLVLALGPLAVYFLGLGLVNSQAHPCMVPARTDFVVLTIALVPLIMGPVLAMVKFGGWWPLAVASVAAAVFVGVLLPRRNSGWVIYNTSLPQCRRLLYRACRRLGLSAEGNDEQVQIAEIGLTVFLTALPVLRNVTLSLRTQSGRHGEGDQAVVRRLMDTLEGEIQEESMLPSPAGASMVVIGAAMLAVPMWFFFHHVDAIARAVRQIFFA
ncbi:MAG: hypothetical protein QUV05_01365 [Phycisphaerae bacterium]|nr:hypothetical protein [Phycisphaerae bacterium]